MWFVGKGGEKGLPKKARLDLLRQVIFWCRENDWFAERVKTVSLQFDATRTPPKANPPRPKPRTGTGLRAEGVGEPSPHLALIVRLESRAKRNREASFGLATLLLVFVGGGITTPQRGRGRWGGGGTLCSPCSPSHLRLTSEGRGARKRKRPASQRVLSRACVCFRGIVMEQVLIWIV